MSRFTNLLTRPLKALRYLSVALKVRLKPKKGVLVIIGAEPWGELAILHAGYRDQGDHQQQDQCDYQRGAALCSAAVAA